MYLIADNNIYLILGLVVVAVIAITAGVLLVMQRLGTPSRHYEGPESVASLYDQWTREQYVEYYWGGHLHVGYYGKSPVKKDFIAAKIDLIDEIIQWGIAESFPVFLERLESSNGSSPKRINILDVGCGIGGTVRYLVNRWPETAQVTGNTISKVQATRAMYLTRVKGIDHAVYCECDANDLAFADASFDIVWALESEPHILDKVRFIRELVRVLKPGGVLIIIAWNVRDSRSNPFSKSEKKHIRYLFDEWNHAAFISINEYVELFNQCGLQQVDYDDWTSETLPSWREGIYEPIRKATGLVKLMPQPWPLLRNAYTLFRLDAAFREGLCQYGLIRGRKAS